MKNRKLIIRKWLAFFMISLFISGITAIPVESELEFLVSKFPFEGSIKGWFQQILIGVKNTGEKYPFLFYGYDWLAFAHIVLAILFIGPIKDPVRNKWVIEFGIITCMLIIPFAMIAGSLRGMPFWWRLVDCSFGIIGLIPLFISIHHIRILEKELNDKTDKEHAFELLMA